MASRLKYISFLLILLLTVAARYQAFALTRAGSSIESQAEINYESGYASSEVSIVIVNQMYGITIELTALSGYGSPGQTRYFPHVLRNLGNGSDCIKLSFKVATPESWGFSLIMDDNDNGTHEVTEVTTLEDPLCISEDAIIHFFIAFEIPTGESSGVTGIANVMATGEVFDGSYYMGADATIYGGPDTVEATDVVTVEALQNLMIYKDIMGDEIYLIWDGGLADIYYIEGTFESTFSGSSIEAYSASSPFLCTIEAKDGRIRFYRAALAGTSTFADRTVGKYDIDTSTGFTFTSVPFVFTSEAATHLDIVIGNQLTGADMPLDSDRTYSYQDKTWKQAYRKTGVGWTGTFQYFSSDLGAWLKILPGHPSGKLTYVGIVSDVASREIALNQGFTMIGHAYPVDVNLDDTGLDKVLTSGDLPRYADRVYSFENGVWKQAYLKTGEGWVGTLDKLEPGRGYWIRKQGIASTWHYPSPY